MQSLLWFRIVHVEYWMFLITSKIRMGVQQRMKTVTTMTSMGTMAFMCNWGRSVLKTKFSYVVKLLLLIFSCLILWWLWKSFLFKAFRQSSKWAQLELIDIDTWVGQMKIWLCDCPYLFLLEPFVPSCLRMWEPPRE